MRFQLLNYLTELLFPRLCVVCGDKLIEQEEWICLHCLHHIPRTNFHLNHDNCLEIIAVKGKAIKLTELSDRLIGVRGIIHGKLVMSRVE